MGDHGYNTITGLLREEIQGDEAAFCCKAPLSEHVPDLSKPLPASQAVFFPGQHPSRHLKEMANNTTINPHKP